MAIFDCFQYFNEDHILDLRFNILDKHVDYFVISESTKTHQGKHKKLNIDKLDYLKIDTQGSELEILKGMKKYKPLLIRLEAHIFSMYKDVPSWHLLLNLLYELNYVVVDWKDIGEHNSRVPAEMDMILIPNFNNDIGKNLIINSKEKFISLMLVFGQINLLKLILKRFNIDMTDLEKFEDLYFN